MPLIERKVLGTGHAEQGLPAPIAWTGGEVLTSANPITYVDIPLPQTTVLNSVQMAVKNLTTPSIPAGFNFYSGGPPLPLTVGPPTIMPGVYFLVIDDWLAQKWHLIGLNEAVERASVGTGFNSAPGVYSVAYVQGLLGSIDINFTPVGNKPSFFSGSSTPLVRYTDGSYHYLLSIFRPFFKGRLSIFINVISVWYPFSLDIQITGYALENISSQGVPDEQISVRVIDETCQELYGVRPGKEEQSDFIETQIQAARVGEQILWQSQMVLDLSAVVPITPAIRRGSTVRIAYPSKNLDVLGLVKNVTHTFNTEAQGMSSQGIATTQCEVKATEFIFRTAGGESQDAEKLDKRQT